MGDTLKKLTICVSFCSSSRLDSQKLCITGVTAARKRSCRRWGGEVSATLHEGPRAQMMLAASLHSNRQDDAYFRNNTHIGVPHPCPSPLTPPHIEAEGPKMLKVVPSMLEPTLSPSFTSHTSIKKACSYPSEDDKGKLGSRARQTLKKGQAGAAGPMTE